VYLLAIGTLIKLVGTAGEALFDGQPAFFESVGLDVELAGRVPLRPGYIIVTDHDVDAVEPGFRKDYQVSSETGLLVNSAGQEYSGDIAYFIAAIDGTDQKDLEGFRQQPQVRQ